MWRLFDGEGRSQFPARRARSARVWWSRRRPGGLHAGLPSVAYLFPESTDWSRGVAGRDSGWFA